MGASNLSQARVLFTGNLFLDILFNLNNWNLNTLEFMASGLWKHSLQILDFRKMVAFQKAPHLLVGRD